MECERTNKQICKHRHKKTLQVNKPATTAELLVTSGIKNETDFASASSGNKSCSRRFFKTLPQNCPPPLKRRAKAKVQVVPVAKLADMKKKMNYEEVKKIEEFNKTDVYSIDQMGFEMESLPTFSSFPSIHRMQMDEWIKEKEQTLNKNQEIVMGKVCTCHIREMIDPGNNFLNLPSPNRIIRLKGPRPQTIRTKEKLLQLKKMRSSSQGLLSKTAVLLKGKRNNEVK